MTNKLITYLLTITRMKQITDDKVIALSKKQYKIEPTVYGTGPSLLKEVVEGNIGKLKIKELKVALALLNKLGVALYPNLTSRRQFFSEIRKAVKENDDKDNKKYKASLDLMKLQKTEKQILKSKSTLKVKEANRNQKAFSSDRILEVIKESSFSDDWAVNSIGLMAAIGARPLELLYLNSYKLDPDKEGWVIVGDLGKKRDGKKDTTVSRPVIFYTPEQFLAKVNQLRKDIEGRDIIDDKNQLIKATSSLLNRRTKQFFPEETPKTMRKLYGNLSYELFADKNTQNINVWLGDILGHDKEDLATSFAYSTVTIKTNTETPRELEVKQDALGQKNSALETKIENLEKKINNLKNVEEKVVACKTTKKNLTNEKKKELVQEAIKATLARGEKLNAERVGCEAGVNWRITRPLVKAKKEELKLDN